MAKSNVDTIISTIKGLADYDITDTALDALILKAINLFHKRMKQWFSDEGMYDEIGATDTFSTVASQEYVDIATETIDFDQPVILTERTNDNPITIIPFKEYRELYPDPSANSTSSPIHAAFFANRLYLGPTPSGVITLYLDYVKLLASLTSGQSMPFEDQYDPLVVAGAMEYLVKWLDRGNTAMIKNAKDDVYELKHELIVGAVKHLGINNQMASRRGEVPYFSPRKPL